MTKLIEKIPGITAYVLLIISGILVLLIYVGGNTDPMDIAGEALDVPKYSDSLLYWSYFLVFLILAITILLTIFGFVKSLIASPIAALKSLIPLVIFVLIFVIAWAMGSSEKISIIGYEGTENQGVWAQFTDMVIYAIYALFAGVIITIIGSSIYTRLK